MSIRAKILTIVLSCILAPVASPQELGPPGPGTLPEQRCLDIRPESVLDQAPLRRGAPPVTVLRGDRPQRYPLSLDEAIATALRQSRIVRVLAGSGAVSAGRTIYDAAIANTDVDVQKSRFDPNLSVDNSWNRVETPQAVLDPLDPTRALIDGFASDDYRLGLATTKRNYVGGQWRLDADSRPTRFRPDVLILNPENRPSVELSYTQPLLQGAGLATNSAPIELARIDTERSYYQFKDALQDEVVGIVEAYWLLVGARVEFWVREQQLLQSDFALRLAEARVRRGLAAGAETAQAQVTVANLKASGITARANVIQREAALRNISGLPPVDGRELVPVTFPVRKPYQPRWEELVSLAEERRPDLVELKLILEADEQLRIQANNNAWPRVDAVGAYRWHGIGGVDPSGAAVASRSGEFTDWTLGVNVNAPLTLRQARAELRRIELAISRDSANLQQGLHAAIHLLATDVRSLDQAFAQFEAFSELRKAARKNLDQQVAEFQKGRIGFINVSQAITDWGNSIISEANSLTQYNALLASLERQTGTILETHGVLLREEHYCAFGPYGRRRGECYPEQTPPTENATRYRSSDKDAEEAFDLSVPDFQPPAKPKQPSKQPPKKPEPKSESKSEPKSTLTRPRGGPLRATHISRELAAGRVLPG